MQKITVYLQVDGVKGERVDPKGNPERKKLPEFTRGMESELMLRFRSADGKPWEDLEEYAAWEFYIGQDWDPETPVLLGISEGISAAGDQVIIPVGNTNTKELAAAIGKSEGEELDFEEFSKKRRHCHWRGAVFHVFRRRQYDFSAIFGL